MSRNEKIGKLARAVRHYRGNYDLQTGKWNQAPQPLKVVLVKRWLRELKMDEHHAILKIDSFQTVQEFDRWLKTL